MVAIVRNQKGKIVWLDQGTATRGFKHILDSHTEDFEEYFDVFMARDIGNFILDAIKNKEILRDYDGDYPGSKLYVYRFGRNYLKMKVDEEGAIVTAFPSKTDYF